MSLGAPLVLIAQIANKNSIFFAFWLRCALAMIDTGGFAPQAKAARMRTVKRAHSAAA